MLKIRLQRVGRAHEPVYRLVLTDSQNGPKSGKTIEVLGSYDSRKAEKAQIDTEKVKGWLSKGAQASPTVHNLLLKLNVISGFKISVLPKKVIEAAKVPKEQPVEEKVPEPVAETASETQAEQEEEKPTESPAPEEKPVETAVEEPKEVV